MRNVARRETILKVIKQYEKFSVLWNTLHPMYYHRPTREKAHQNLWIIWQQYEPTITLKDFKKKLDQMRSMHRRERKKIEYSIMSGGPVRKPKLWYYEHLGFLSGQGVISDEGEQDDEEEENQEQDKSTNSRKRRASQLDQQHPEESIIDQDELDVKDEQFKKKEPNKNDEPIEDSSVAFGKSISAQLHQLSATQRSIAEKLITDVLHYGKLEKLNVNSSLNLESPVEVVIPETGPSWYDVENRFHQSSSSTTNFDAKDREETANAASFLLGELNGTEI